MRRLQLVNYFKHCDTIHQQFYDFRVKTLVRQDHPTIWKLIDKLRKKNSFAQQSVVRTRVRVQTQQLHNRLLNPCQRYQDNNIQLDDFLRAVGRNIRVGVRQEQE